MTLCHHRGRFLFEVRHDLFTQGRLTPEELELWGMFAEEHFKARPGDG